MTSTGPPATGLRERLGLPRTQGRGRLLAASAIDATGSGLFVPFQLVYFVATTPLSLAAVGGALTLAATLALPLPTLLGPLVDRFGPRRVVAAGNVLSAAGFAGYLVAQQVWSVTLAALLANIGATTFWTASGALVALAADEGERSRWFGLIRALRNAGIGLGGALAAGLLAAVGRSGFHVIVVGNIVSYLLAAGLTMAWRPERPETHAVPEHAARPGLRAVLRDTTFVLLVAIHLLFVLATVLPTLLLAVYIVRDLGGPTWAAAALLVVNTALIALGQTTLTRHVEHRDRVWLLALGAVFYGCSFVMLAALLLAPAAVVAVGLVAAMVVFTFGEMAQMAAVSDLVVSLSPPHLRGRYQGLFQLSWSLGIAIAPGAFAWLLDRGAVWPWAVGTMGCAVAAASLVALHPRVPAAALVGQEAGWNVAKKTSSASALDDHAESGVDQ